MPKIIKDVKDKILLDAKELLINSNYAAFNIRDLSKKSSISTGTIYNHFTNKRELVNAVFVADWNNSLERMQQINKNYFSLEEKLFQMYIEIDDFLKLYLNIFLEISSFAKSNCPPTYLKSLYLLIGEILQFERTKGTITTSLSNEKLCKFIVNNLMLLCTDKTLTFKEFYSLIKL